MATHQVQYEISLKDLLSGKIKQAEGNVNHFEQALGRTTSLTKELMGAAVGFFGAYQALEFVKGSVEAYNVQERALSQLRAGLQSTKGAAGVTYEELIEQADRFKAITIYDDDVINDMQAQLLSFPEVSKAVFEDAEQAIMDLATRTHRGLNEVSVMVGKALSDPAKGVAALHRVGVEFSEQQIKVIKHLQDTNQLAAAQKLILQELSKEYGGSTAEASATAAGQMEILKHEFEDVKEDVGKLVMEYSIKLAPTIKNLIKDAKDFVHWLDKNKETIVSVGKAVVEVTAIMWAWGKATAIIEGSIAAWRTLETAILATKTAVQSVAAAEVGLGAASVTTAATTAGATTLARAETAALSGTIMAGSSAVGSIAMMAGAAVVGLNIWALWTALKEGTGNFGKDEAEVKAQADKHFLEDDKQYDLENIVTNENDRYQRGLSEHKSQQELGVYEARRINQLYPSQLSTILDYIDNDLSQLPEVMREIVKDKDSIKKFAHLNPAEDSYKMQEFSAWIKSIVSSIRGRKGSGGTSGADATLAGLQSSVTGQNVKNYHITINGGLIHDFTVHSRSVREAVPDIKRVVTEAMTDAMNDSQLNG